MVDHAQRAARGRARRCRAEWRLIAATDNLLKLWRLTTPAQPA
jgi:hypothetical protein